MNERLWPPWWSWELELSAHLLERMEDRSFTEVDLRSMLEEGSRYRRDIVEGRWVIETRHNRWEWEVVVEPLRPERRLLVITAYPLDETRKAP